MPCSTAKPANTLLLVEDEPLLREPLANYLTRKGWQVFQAANGLQAWEILDQKEVRVMLTDLHMPFVDGFTLIQKIQETPRHAGVLIVAMSGTPGPEVEAIRRTRPGLPFLGKPFSLSELDSTLEQAVESRISF